MRSETLRSGAAGGVAALATVAVELASSGVKVAGEGARAIAAYLAIGVALATVAAAIAALVAAAGYGLARLLPTLVCGGEAGRRWWSARITDRAAAGDLAAVLHGAAVATAVFVAAMTLTVAFLSFRFREPTLIGLVAAAVGLLWALIAIAVGVVLFALLRGGGRARRLLPERQERFDPLANPRAAAIAWLGLAWLGVLVALRTWPGFTIVFPIRIAASLSIFTLVLLESGRYVRAFCDRPGRSRRAVLLVAAAMLLSTGLTLPLVTNPAARRAALSSPTLALLIDAILHASDFDRDGYSSLLGGGDCAPFDGDIHPGARERPDDGIDQNCFGGDFAPSPRPSPLPDRELPPELSRQDYSILLITVDALRYDHTGMAGFALPVTPNLDRLARSGVWFDHLYSTGSLTKDVLPTLVCSQFMEELPLGDRIQSGSPAMPHRLEPEAVTLAETLRAAGYRTAIFTAFGYFDGWGLEQGMDEVVNLEAEGPIYATAPLLTERAIAWLETVPAGQRWFLWIHYLEPHYPYEAHPGSPSFGDTEPERYAAELRFVDEQIGRWSSWIAADPGRASRTIVAVTSDHGEELGERGRFGHGLALWEYLVHVPLAIALPGVSPRRVATPASLIDLAPTLVALAGVAADPSWTGRAHLAEIAYGSDQPDRIVFAAETHKRIYAAITTDWKLLRDDHRNLFQLVDLRSDPGEARDGSADHPEIYQRLRTAMFGWRERVVGADLAAAAREPPAQ